MQNKRLWIWIRPSYKLFTFQEEMKFKHIVQWLSLSFSCNMSFSRIFRFSSTQKFAFPPRRKEEHNEIDYEKIMKKIIEIKVHSYLISMLNMYILVKSGTTTIHRNVSAAQLHQLHRIIDRSKDSLVKKNDLCGVIRMWYFSSSNMFTFVKYWSLLDKWVRIKSN